MKADLTQKLINTWEWLNCYCLSVRDNQDLKCGNHAVCIVQIDDFDYLRVAWGKEKTEQILNQMESIMSAYAFSDSLIARYNDSTFVVVLHYLDDIEDSVNLCEEIRDVIHEAKLGGDHPLTVSIGASRCRHDPNVGYQCAMVCAMDALQEAKKKKDSVLLSHSIA